MAMFSGIAVSYRLGGMSDGTFLPSATDIPPRDNYRDGGRMLASQT